MSAIRFILNCFGTNSKIHEIGVYLGEENYPVFMFCLKAIVQLQATQEKLVSGMRGEHEKTENHKIDSLPQESSTPRRNEKDDGIFSFLLFSLVLFIAICLVILVLLSSSRH